MLIAGRNGMMVSKSILPPGARWVEYLESTGTQYIETQYIPQNQDALRCDVLIRYSADYGSVFSAGTGTYQLIALSTAILSPDLLETIFLKYFASGNAKSVTVLKNIWYTIVVDSDGTFHIGNQSVVSPFEHALDGANTNLWLFRRRNNTSNLSGCMKSFTVVRNGAPFLDLRPIAIGTTGYMLDLVTGDYLQYGNAGTGDFVIGPDISAPQLVGGGGGNLLELPKPLPKTYIYEGEVPLWKEVA